MRDRPVFAWKKMLRVGWHKTLRPLRDWGDRLRRAGSLGFVLLLLLISPGLTQCSLPQVKAEDRLFLPLTVEFVDAYTLPVGTTVAGVPLGGLSAIAYDRQADRLLAVSDDRSEYGAARFYTLELSLDRRDRQHPAIAAVTVTAVTPLLSPEGRPYAANTIDAEGLALSPRQTVFISSEGVAATAADPFIAEFDRATGQWLQSLTLPDRFLRGQLTPAPEDKSELAMSGDRATPDPPTKGVQDNAGLEALTIQPVGMAAPMVEPFRLFAATESALIQDLDSTGTDPTIRNRFLHYLIGDDQISLISEYVYALDPDPIGAVSNGLSELLVLDQGGHFLGLERSFGLQGFNAKLFQLATGGATDVSGRVALTGDLSGIAPIQKRLMLDFRTLPPELNLTVDNLEGMTLGPRLPDGSQSLLMVSDNNFNENQVTQFLLFRLR